MMVRLQARMGSTMMQLATMAAEEKGLDRSAWADKVLTKAIESGLRKMEPEALIAGLARDDRIVMMVPEETADAVREAAAELEIPLATFVIMAFAGELSRPRRR